MACKMAAKIRMILCFFFFLYINISLRFVCVKFALVAMNVRFLHIICNFENFSTVRWPPNWKILFIGDFCCSF